MIETLPNKTDISDIESSKDGKNILDTPDKIIRWIKHKFEEQALKSNDVGPEYRYIDLSNCIISTGSHDGKPAITNLYDIIIRNEEDNLLDCFINNGYGNTYYHEVKKKIICTNSIIHSAFFQHTKFHEDVSFEGTEFKGGANFFRCLFERHANFQNTIYTGNFDFENCIFNDLVLFHNAKLDVYEISFDYSIFKAELSAEKIEFINDDKKNEIPNSAPNISFQKAEFYGELNLSNINFTRNCIFNEAKFESSVKFENSHFKTDVYFNDTEINGNILFTIDTDKEEDSEIVLRNIINKIYFYRSRISGRIDIERCKIDELKGGFLNIKDGAILRIYQSSIKSLNLTSIHNKGIIILEDNEDKIDKLILKSAINFGIIEVENTTIKNITDRKTARLLKDSALKCGNNIDALEYRKEEMRLFKKEPSKKRREHTFLLWLNGLSNNHGTNYLKGIKFTISCWIGFYSLFLVVSRVSGIFSWLNGQPVIPFYLQNCSKNKFV